MSCNSRDLRPMIDHNALASSFLKLRIWFSFLFFFWKKKRFVRSRAICFAIERVGRDLVAHFDLWSVSPCVLSLIGWLETGAAGGWTSFVCVLATDQILEPTTRKKKDKTFRRIDTELTEFAIWTFRLKIPNRATTKKCCKFYANFMQILHLFKSWEKCSIFSFVVAPFGCQNEIRCSPEEVPSPPFYYYYFHFLAVGLGVVYSPTVDDFFVAGLNKNVSEWWRQCKSISGAEHFLKLSHNTTDVLDIFWHFQRNSFDCTSIDSSGDVTSNVYWVRVDPVKCLAASWRKSPKMALSPNDFRWLAVQRSVRSSWSQNRKCRVFRELSNGHEFHLI